MKCRLIINFFLLWQTFKKTLIILACMNQLFKIKDIVT